MFVWFIVVLLMNWLIWFSVIGLFVVSVVIMVVVLVGLMFSIVVLVVCLVR